MVWRSDRSWRSCSCSDRPSKRITPPLGAVRPITLMAGGGLPPPPPPRGRWTRRPAPAPPEAGGGGGGEGAAGGEGKRPGGRAGNARQPGLWVVEIGEGFRQPRGVGGAGAANHLLAQAVLAPPPA